MRRPYTARRAVLASVATLVTVAVWSGPESRSTSAATLQGTVAGEGGDAATPEMVKLLHDDAAGLNPDFGSYTNVDLEQGILDFIGSSPGTFGNDFLVTERPLTTAEAATATTNGRSFAYVPLAASPVALVTLVPNSSYNGSTTILSSQFCQHIPLSLDQLDGIYGAVTPQYSGWGDSRISCAAPPAAPTPPDAIAFGRWANLDPTMENYSLMSLLDSTTASRASFGAGLTAAQALAQSATSDPTASEHWPYTGTAVAGGDQATLGKPIGLDPRSGAPSTQASRLSLGAIMPVTSVWTGTPLGVKWDLPTAAVQDAAGSFVAPSADSAKSAEGNATLASTTDPKTNNLVTFNPSPTDGTAYNNVLMLESYLVVPTNGLPSDKALALAQFIRFAVGTAGQADITALGAAPATSAMATADLAVAQQLDAEAVSASSTTATTTTTAAGASPPAAAAASSGTGTGSSTTATLSSTGNTGSTSNDLAVTGGNPVPLLGLGFALLAFGEFARRFLRRRKARA